MNLRKFEGKNIHIVGVSGAEGSAVAEFFADNLKKKKIHTHDFCEEGEFKKSFMNFHDGLKRSERNELYEKIINLKLNFNFGKDYLKGIKDADIIVVPQSWYRYKENEVLHRYKNKASFYNITKLYFKLCPCKIIGVTGTSGKSTTSKLIYEILKRSGQKAYLTGNDRQNVQVLDQLQEMNKTDYLVMEISNRQLKIDLKKSPHISVITNITPSHLDDHKNYEEYMATKKSILAYQKDRDFAVLNYDNSVTKEFGREAKASVSYFSTKMPQETGAYVENGDLMIKHDGREYRICSVRDIMLKGPHNVENVLAAAAASYLAGAGTKDIREVVTMFKGLESRLELVKEIKRVEYYEDSQSCNPEGTRFAVQSFTNPNISNKTRSLTRAINNGSVLYYCVEHDRV